MSDKVTYWTVCGQPKRRQFEDRLSITFYGLYQFPCCPIILRASHYLWSSSPILVAEHILPQYILDGLASSSFLKMTTSEGRDNLSLLQPSKLSFFSSALHRNLLKHWIGKAGFLVAIATKCFCWTGLPWYYLDSCVPINLWEFIRVIQFNTFPKYGDNFKLGF